MMKVLGVLLSLMLATGAQAQTATITPTDWVILTITSLVIVIALGVWFYRLTH